MIEVVRTKEIKLLDINHKKDLSELINEELSNVDEYQTIHEIKYVATNDGWRYALIIYSKTINNDDLVCQRGSYYMDDEAVRGTLFEGGIE